MFDIATVSCEFLKMKAFVIVIEIALLATMFTDVIAIEDPETESEDVQKFKRVKSDGRITARWPPEGMLF